MERKDMLDELHRITLGVQLTVLPSEGALECEYVTKNGYTYEWIGIDDWPLYEIRDVSRERFNLIIKKISSGTLTYADTEGTEFLTLYVDDVNNDRNHPSLSEFFSSLLTISLPSDSVIYAFLDVRHSEPQLFFYSTYDELTQAFLNRYVICDERWEDYDDAELTGWIERIRDEFDDLPVTTLSEEET